MRPLVTLVTPVYNAMPWLRDYLDCVVRQTWRPLEVIVVDDGSTDGSADCLREIRPVLEQAGLIVHVLFCQHKGQSAAFNAALPLISGEFFTWCDADDLLTPDSVEKKVLWLLAHPEIGMVRSNGIVLDADTGTVLSDSAKASDRRNKIIFEELFCDQTYCFAGCYMIRSSLFFTGYPNRQMPNSPEGQNLQLLLPAASRTVCGYLDEKLHIYRRRAGSHSSQKRSYRESLRRITNFTTLRLEILKYCVCDTAYFTRLAEQREKEARSTLLYSAAKQAREERKI